MQKYWNTVTKRTGAVVSGASVTVTTYPAGGAATIYSDDGVTPAANPLTTDANGFFSFYAADGRYSIAVTGNDITPYSIDDVALIEDPADDKADIAALQADVATRALSADLASTASGKGVALLGYSTAGETAKAALDARLPEIGTYALLRAYSGALTSFYVRGVASLFDGGAGVFRVDASDTTSADNGGTILVDALGRRWKREFVGPACVAWWGARPANAENGAALNAAYASGFAEIGHEAGVYLSAQNLRLPSSARTRLFGAGLDETVVRGVAGIANADYFAAQSAYIDNATAGSAPLIIDGMQFDGAGLVAHAAVIYSYSSVVRDSAVVGGTSASLVFTSNGISGSSCSTTLVENAVRGCRLAATGAAYALRVADSAGRCTDMQVEGNICNGDVLFDTMAGTNFSGNHVYAGDATFKRLSTGSIVSGNYFENGVVSDDYKDEIVSFGPNIYLGRVTCSFGASAKDIIFNGGTWQGTADLYHNYFAADKRIVVNGGGFETATPVVFHNGSSTGRVVFNRVWNYATGNHWTGSRNALVSSIRQEIPFAPVVSSNWGDSSATLTWTVHAPTNRWSSALTANRTVTLDTANAINGARFRITRAGGGAFTLDVGGLKSLAAAQWCEVEYDGAAWVLTAYGAL